MADLPVTLGDVIVVAILLISGLLAFVRGFVQEVLDVAAWIGAIVAALLGYPLLAPHLGDLIADPRIARVAAGGIIFVVAIIILSVITRLISRSVRNVGLGALDRSLGFVFGLARGALLVVLVYIAVDFLVAPEEQPEWLKEARSLALIEEGADWVRSAVPGGVLDDEAPGGRATATEDQRTRKADEMFREMVSPEPKGATNTGVREGYGDAERRDMQRLLESSTGAR